MFDSSYPKDQDIINQTNNSLQPFQDLAHSFLKELRGAGYAKGEFITAETTTGRDKGS